MSTWRLALVLGALACGAVLPPPRLQESPEALCALSLVPRLLGHSQQPRLFVIGAAPWLDAFLGRRPATTEVTVLTHFHEELAQRMTMEDAVVMVCWSNNRGLVACRERVINGTFSVHGCLHLYPTPKTNTGIIFLVVRLLVTDSGCRTLPEF